MKLSCSTAPVDMVLCVAGGDGIGHHMEVPVCCSEGRPLCGRVLLCRAHQQQTAGGHRHQGLSPALRLGLRLARRKTLVNLGCKLQTRASDLKPRAAHGRALVDTHVVG
jgi:hypothetical protein